MEKVEKFYKDMYGDDAPEVFESMKSKVLFEFAEAYSQSQNIGKLIDEIKIMKQTAKERYEKGIDKCNSFGQFQAYGQVLQLINL